jgi:hypothetical protein
VGEACSVRVRGWSAVRAPHAASRHLSSRTTWAVQSLNRNQRPFAAARSSKLRAGLLTTRSCTSGLRRRPRQRDWPATDGVLRNADETPAYDRSGRRRRGSALERLERSARTRLCLVVHRDRDSARRTMGRRARCKGARTAVDQALGGGCSCRVLERWRPSAVVAAVVMQTLCRCPRLRGTENEGRKQLGIRS